MKLQDITGQRFGRLTVLERAADKWGSPSWLCKCDCGTVKSIPTSNLKSKSHTPTRSCGCLAAEMCSARSRKRIKHGIGGTSIYKTWHGMLSRCSDPEHQAFHNYGGRGIKVCEWLRASPLNLLSLVGNSKKGFSLDRINNDLHYSCGQCKECSSNGWAKNLRWATTLQQHRNTRRNVKVEINGERLCLSEWAARSGTPQNVIRYRVRAKWSPERLLIPSTK